MESAVAKDSAVSILFMGTPGFAVPTLRALVHEAGFDVIGVVTRAPKPRGRGGKGGRRPLPTPIKEFALENGIAVYEPRSIRDDGFFELVRSLGPDLIVVVAYGKILPERLLAIPPLGCLNLHASLLPAYRGAAPVNRAIINGEKETGVVAMLMDAGMDTGPVLLREAIEIGAQETAGELLERLSKIGAPLVIRAIRLLAEGRARPVAQDGSKATYAPVLSKEDGRIDWKLGARRIANCVRGLSPWPGAYTYWNGKLLKIHSGTAGAPEEADASRGARPGTVVEALEKGIGVMCGDGVFWITELQLEGKKAMSAAEFIRGHAIGKDFFG